MEHRPDRSVATTAPIRWIRSIAKAIGPGVITGAADDDPSGIATYSVAGAQLGTKLLWTALLTWPLMAAVQMMCARIGKVTGEGLAANFKQRFPRWLLLTFVIALLAANTINIAADLAGMADAAAMLSGVNSHWFVIAFAIFISWATVRLQYRQIASVLKWLVLVLFAYPITAFVVGANWSQVLRDTLMPSMPHSRNEWETLVAILGTTISPYLFFWQASEEVDNAREDPEAEPLIKAPAQAPRQLARIQLDTLVGMGFSNIIALFIMLTTAATLNAHGVKDIQTSSQAAEALRPIAGEFAFAIFALGIIGTGLLAVPVLAGSVGYAVGEAFRWRVGLAQLPGRAPAFYATIAAATLVGAALNFTPLDPIKALFWSAVLNGVAAVPIMVMFMVMGSREAVMGPFTLKPLLRTLGWVATAVMGAAAVGMFATWGN